MYFQYLEFISKSTASAKFVIPAEAGIQNCSNTLDSRHRRVAEETRLHGNDGEGRNFEETAF